MKWACLAAAAATLLGCGGDYCSNMEQFGSDAVQRNGSCNGGDSFTAGFSQAACENALSSKACTGADQSALAQASSCLNSLPQCTPGTETTFDGESVTCAGYAQNVSGPCNVALLEAGAPVLSLDFSGSCTAAGGSCATGGDCCSGSCGSGNTCG